MSEKFMKKISIGLLVLLVSVSASASEYECKYEAVRQNLHRGYSGKLLIKSPEVISVETYRVVCALHEKQIICRNIYEPELFTLHPGGTYLGNDSNKTLVIHEYRRNFDAVIYGDVRTASVVADFRKCKEVSP